MQANPPTPSVSGFQKLTRLFLARPFNFQPC
jgi:hypothetical protein